MKNKRFIKSEYDYDWWFVFDKKQEYTAKHGIPYKDMGDLIPMSEDQVIKLLNENEQLNENNLHLHHELRLKNDKLLALEKENKKLSEQVEYLKKQVKIFKGECKRLTKENTELLEEL